MSKQLLVDYIPFEVTAQQINESLAKNGKLIVNGVLQRADAKNQNGRVYPHETLMREAENYSKVQVKERRALGELDHPDSSVVNLNNVSHNVLEMHWKGKDLIGTVEVLGTPAGNILKELFKAGIKLGISSRGLGSVEELGEGEHVLANCGVHTLALKTAFTIPSGGIQDDFIYLTHGGTTAGTYDAGIFLLRFFGTPIV